MTNPKLRVVSARTTTQPADETSSTGCIPPSEEGLRLIRAFMAIRDPAKRAALVRQAEYIASST
jgi:hypothetical protein